MSNHEQQQSQQQTQPQSPVFTLEELKARLDAGFQKSVTTMVEDIVKEYVMRIDNGTRVFKYIKAWPQKGSFMSAAYTQGDRMQYDGKDNCIGYNTTLQPQEDVDKFTKLVFDEITTKHGILVTDSKVEYRDNKTGWHHMRFELTLTLAENG
jgi:hypothetical protein